MPTKKKVAKRSTTTKKSGKAGAGSAGKIAKKKKVATKKVAPKKKKPVVKKRKTTRKKSIATEASVISMPLITISDDEEITPDAPGSETPSVPPMEPMPQDDSKENTYIESKTSCGSCRHMPVSANAIVGMLSIMALALSIAVVTSLITIESQDYQIRAFNAGGAYLEEVARL